MGKDEVGAGACDGVAEPGVDVSWEPVSAAAAPSGRSPSSTYPQEAGRTPTEYPVRIVDGGFSPRRCACPASRRRGRCALDVVIEALDNIAGARLLEVLRFDSQDVIFELQLPPPGSACTLHHASCLCTDQIVIDQALLVQRFAEVPSQSLVVGHAARAVCARIIAAAWGRIFRHCEVSVASCAIVPTSCRSNVACVYRICGLVVRQVAVYLW